MSDESIVQMYTDGACRGNPGPGGWGVVIRFKEHEKTLYGHDTHTTNNRMEMMAAIEGLRSLKRECKVSITTDSEYLRRGVTEWMAKWKQNGWRSASKKPVKNRDLWVILDELIVDHDITWHWVKGHSGHPENEMADALANQGIDEMLGDL